MLSRAAAAAQRIVAGNDPNNLLVPEESPRNSGNGVVGEVDRPEVVHFGQEVFRKRAEKVV